MRNVCPTIAKLVHSVLVAHVTFVTSDTCMIFISWLPSLHYWSSWRSVNMPLKKQRKNSGRGRAKKTSAPTRSASITLFWWFNMASWYSRLSLSGSSISHQSEWYDLLMCTKFVQDELRTLADTLPVSYKYVQYVLHTFKVRWVRSQCVGHTLNTSMYVWYKLPIS